MKEAQEQEARLAQAKALLKSIGEEAEYRSLTEEKGQTLLTGGKGKDQFELVMDEEGKLVSYAQRRP